MAIELGTKKMKNSRFDHLKSQKHSLSSSLDENSKKIQKLRIKIKDSKLNKSMPPSVQMDMKSVRVLVERTKFNVMLNLDHKLRHNNTPKSSISRPELKKTSSKVLQNKAAPLASSTPQRQQHSPQKKSPSKTATTKTISANHQPPIDAIFKIRKCCIKLPKDKLLLQLQKKQIPYPVKLIVHKVRGRPKKEPIEMDSLLMVESPSPGQKRKSLENPSSSSPPKRKVKKGNEFFIKIGALTRAPSPRRKPASNSVSPEAKPPLTSKQRRKTAKKLNKKALASSRLAPLRQKFGSRFFKSFVKIKRTGPNSVQKSSFSPPKTDNPPKKKKNGKNLSVSFLETVEIFGESSDDEDWFETDAKNSSRITKPLDNLFDSLKTSTPCIRSSSSPSNSSSSGILKSSILDRKEKISFSPLKETDTESPRKQQLKLANESFVRRSLETQIADDERDIAEDLTEEADLAEKSSTVPESGIVNDIEHNSSECSFKTNDASSALETHQPNICDDKDDDEEKAEQLNSSNDSTEDTSSRHAHNSNEDEEESTAISNNQENEDSFKSANASYNEEVSAETGIPEKTENLPIATEAEPDENLNENLNEITADNEPEQSLDEIKADEEPEENLDDSNADEETADQEEQEDIANEDEISKEDVCPDDEEPFADPSKLVVSVLLNESTEEERNEAEAVLNDVCQMAAAESVVLLNPATHLTYSSPHSAMDDDDDDDFNSVLTHPETEKTLQSAAASDLVPNSQEIAVEAAVASQATMVAPADVDVTEDTFASVVAEVERFTKDVNSEIYSADVGITGADVMMDNVQARHSLDDIFDDDVDGQSHMFLQFPDDIMSSLRISSGSIDIGHDKSLPIQVIETEVMTIPNEPDLIFDKPIGTTASSLMNGPQINSAANDTLPGHGGPTSTPDSNKKLFGRIFQSVKSYVMSPGGEKNLSLQD